MKDGTTYMQNDVLARILLPWPYLVCDLSIVRPSFSSRSFQQSASNDQNRAVEGSSHTTTSPRATKHTGSSSLASGMGVTVPNATRPGVMTTDYPPAIAMVAEDPPSLEFPGLHKVSLVAGPRGARCLEVRLAVLQKLCPPVHQRLVKVADKRWVRRGEVGWMGLAYLFRRRLM